MFLIRRQQLSWLKINVFLENQQIKFTDFLPVYLQNFWLGNTRLFIVPLCKLSSFCRSTDISLSQL